MPRAFLTGSRVYGVPKKTSDVDLVVPMSLETFNKLTKWAENADEIEQHYGNVVKQLRFGNINILAATTPDEYDCWKEGTKLLKLRDEPVSRADAIEVFRELRRAKGLFKK